MLTNKLMGASGEAQNPNFENVTLLLHGDGTNGAQNNTFLDSSPNSFTITRNGNATQGSFSPYGDLWSNYFDGSGDYLTAPSNTAFALPGDFTIEAWVYVISATSYALICGGPTSDPTWYLEYSQNRGLGFYGAGAFLDGSASVVTNQWVHLAVSRSGSSLRFFANGTVTATHSTSASFPQILLGIGAYNGGQLPVNGYISNLRIVKGTAVYTSNFTPPTSPLTAISGTSLLTCQSNRFIDNSSNNFTITKYGDTKVTNFAPFNPTAAYSPAVNGGSGYFDGDADYLSVPNNTAFAMGSSDFTIEGWFYQTNSTGYQVVCGKYEPSYQASWAIQLYGTTMQVYIYYGSTSYLTVYNGTAPAINQWNHFALERNGAYNEFYLNGVRVAQVGAQTMRTTTSAVAIGRTGAGYSEYFYGYISNLRIVKGTAVYSGATYTVPTSPLTAITNTSLLCNFTNAGIYDNSMKNDLETVGNAQISTSVKKYGTGSLFSSASSGYLSIPYTNSFFDLGFSSESFTIEAWINPTYVTAKQTIFSKGGGDNSWSTSNGAQYELYVSNYALVWDFNTAGSVTRITSDVSISTSSWVHIAVTYSGTTTRMFVGGVLQTTTSALSYTAPTTRNKVYVGITQAASNAYNGYIDDLRITKGVARYTTNFTPPTQAFPNQ